MTLVNSSGATVLVQATWRPPDEFDEFRISRSLGFGAMGQVYLAHDRLLERPVAVKFVDPAADPAARARVLDEARAIARLQHPNVVAIYRVAEFAGHPYLVCEYVHGRTLSELERPMPWRAVLDIARDLTRGLAAAHRRGVLHRDVKPANAILAEDGQAKLLDFGLATITDASQAEVLVIAHASDGGERRNADDLAARAKLVTDQTAPMPPAGAASQVLEARAMMPQLVGTPAYMAPEVWRGELATRRSDLYSLGILLYELLTGDAPFRDVAIGDLANAVQHGDIPRLGDLAPGVDPALAAIVDRLVERDPKARFRSADALLAALDECAAPASMVVHPDGNPYRGLAVFESAHTSVFFGRASDVRELVDRVRIEPFVVVGGDSGTGKSSLCRAGVLPWLAEHGGWSCVEVVPGRHPVQSLAAALAPWSGSAEAGLAELLRDRPDEVAHAIRQHLTAAAAPTAGPPRRLLLFVDQLEELLTLSDPDEVRVVAAAIAALAVRSPSVRVLATARSDFLSRLAMLPDLGDEMARGLYFLRPLGGEQIREVIVRPAAVKGVRYESDALVDMLVVQTEGAPGGLPLLQFTLTELWDARDLEGRMIRAGSLAALGGVTGALTRHADRLLAGLSTDERDAARRMLLRLVTAKGTRARRAKTELVAEGAAHDAEQAALEVLVRGRVVVANNAKDGAYEIAHEALLTSWSTLQGWLQRDAANQPVRESVEQAAAAWQRMGRARDLLWGRRQLAEARALDRVSLAPREAGFLAASGKAMRQRRMLGAGGAAILAIAVVIVGLAIRARARRELDQVIAEQTEAATSAQISARQTAVSRDAARRRALGLFDAHHWTEAEDVWSGVIAMQSREEREYRTAASHLESILLLDPTRPGLRNWASDLTFERLVRAERDRHHDLADELAMRLVMYNDGRYMTKLDAPGRAEFTVAPPGTKVWIERTGAARELLGQAPLAAQQLPTGSAVLVFEAPGRVSARLPVLVGRGETLEIRVTLPAAATAPAGMLYVPPGRFLFGSEDGTELRRGFLSAAPLHEVWTEGYFIARYEVSFADWIAFLDDLAPDERLRRAPHAVDERKSALSLTEIAPRHWRFTMTPTTRTYAAETGQRLHYDGRSRHADQDWTRFPVAAVSYEDAVAYVAWLDRTGRIQGARLCDEYEWERAARGADARVFPSGATLAPDDANIDVTYGREPVAFGPDEVGSHPASRSPIGADDMAGNVYEWTRSVEVLDTPITRGGCWYQDDLAARTMNRSHTEPTLRHPCVGVRVCATPR